MRSKNQRHALALPCAFAICRVPAPLPVTRMTLGLAGRVDRAA